MLFRSEVTTKGEIPFKHLKFVLYDRTGISGEFDNGSNIVYTGTIPYSEVSGEYTEFSLLGATGDETMKIAGNHTTKNLRLFVWLDEAGADNDAEQGATFKGTVNVEVKDFELLIIAGIAMLILYVVILFLIFGVYVAIW